MAGRPEGGVGSTGLNSFSQARDVSASRASTPLSPSATSPLEWGDYKASPPQAACGSGSNAGRLVLISSEIQAAAIAVMPAMRKASS